MTAVELLEKPENWCQGSFARDSDGTCVPVDDETASKWCVYGAVMKTHVKDFDFYIGKLCDLTNVYGPLVLWNDDPKRTHEEVLEVLRKVGA